MARPIQFILIFISFLILSAPQIQGQTRTVGLMQNDSSAFVGYSLFSSLRYNTTYLIDNEGRLINSWESNYVPGNSAYLLEDGSLLRCSDPGGNPRFVAGGDGGLVERFDWDGNLTWQFEYNNDQHRLHHDIEPLPNGNVLMIAWEYRSYADAIAAGRDSMLIPQGELWPEHIIEVEPVGFDSGTIVWAWHSWDHLIQDFDSTKANFGVVADHPELIDINYVRGSGLPDWQHVNSIDYNPQLDQIIVNSPFFNEFWVIDHSTTTQEAAGHSGGNSGMGGDILFRWGNPRTYGAGQESDQQFFNQHHVHWNAAGLPGEGLIMIFNNGLNRPEGDFTTIDEIIPPLDGNGGYIQPSGPGVPFGPADIAVRYMADPPTDFYSQFISGSQRLPNGNTLICSGAQGRFFEVDTAGVQVWEYINPVGASGPIEQGEPMPQGSNTTFRLTRYAPDFAGFQGRDLTPGDPIEIYPVGIDDPKDIIAGGFNLEQNYPNPFNPKTDIRYQISDIRFINLLVYDVMGRKVKTLVSERQSAGEYTAAWDGRDDGGREVASGVYYYRLQSGQFNQTRKMLLVR